jgi:hypothetical protein
MKMVKAFVGIIFMTVTNLCFSFRPFVVCYDGEYVYYFYNTVIIIISPNNWILSQPGGCCYTVQKNKRVCGFNYFEFTYVIVNDTQEVWSLLIALKYL